MGTQLATLQKTKDFLTAEANNRVISLPSGRKVSYAEFGEVSAHPLFLCSGIDGCRFFINFITCLTPKNEETKTKLLEKFRIFSIDFPGYGETTHQVKRSLSSFCDLFVEFVNAVLRCRRHCARRDRNTRH